MPTIEDLKAELIEERKSAAEKKAAFEKAAKELEAKGVEMDEKLKKSLDVAEGAKKAVDEIMLQLAKPGAVPGNAGDKKGAEIAASALRKFFSMREHEMTVEEKSLVLSSAPDGGALIPTERAARIIEKVVEISPVRTLATVMQTRVDHLEMVKETGQLAATWTAETGTRSEDTATKFGLERIPVHGQTALVKMSRQLQSDSPIDLEAWLGSRAALKFGKGEGQAFLTGNGVGRPQGILASTSGVTGTTSTTAASGEFTPDDVLNCEADLISTYAQKATWLFNRAAANFIRKFKDNENRYLNMVQLDQLAMLKEGVRQLMLNGYPLREAVDLTAMAASAKVGIFGDFKEGYTIVDRENMVVIRDIYSSKTTGLIDYLFERRVGGQVVQTDAMRYLACKA